MICGNIQQSFGIGLEFFVSSEIVSDPKAVPDCHTRLRACQPPHLLVRLGNSLRTHVPPNLGEREKQSQMEVSKRS